MMKPTDKTPVSASPLGARGVLDSCAVLMASRPLLRVLLDERASTTFETALMMAFVLIPITFGLIMTTGALWTWSGVVHLTRIGATYAATHCWQDPGGSNVVAYMQANLPPVLDPNQITNGQAQISVQYWTQDPVGHQTIPFICGASCAPDCAPDAVTVTVTGYQFNVVTGIIGLQPIPMPPFSTSVQVESAGANPDIGAYLP
jgi:hypothetical protein